MECPHLKLRRHLPLGFSKQNLNRVSFIFHFLLYCKLCLDICIVLLVVCISFVFNYSILCCKVNGGPLVNQYSLKGNPP